MSYHPRIEDLKKRRLVGKDGTDKFEQKHPLVQDEIVANTTLSIDYGTVRKRAFNLVK